MDLDAVLDATFGAAEANDWATFRSMFVDDAVMVQNVGRAQSIDESMVTLPAFTADGTTLKYENVRRVRGPLSITEMHDAVFTKPDGRQIRIDICVVVQFNRDGCLEESQRRHGVAPGSGALLGWPYSHCIMCKHD